MSRPHFEKMLYNQALTASLYYDAANWLGRPDFRRFAHTIVAFTRSTLRLQDGRYGAAVDADFEGEEGAYYLWNPVDIGELPDGARPIDFQGRVFLAGAPIGPAGV